MLVEKIDFLGLFHLMYEKCLIPNVIVLISYGFMQSSFLDLELIVKAKRFLSA